MTPADPERLADLADLLLTIARRISISEVEPDGVVRLCPSESLVMRFIDHHPGCKPSEIGAQLGLRSANTSAALRSLEDKGLVRRSPDPTDRRAVLVESTAKAARNLAQIRAHWAALLGPLLADAGDVDTAVRVLSGLDNAFHARA